jgi:hypothetical protein
VAQRGPRQAPACPSVDSGARWSEGQRQGREKSPVKLAAVSQPVKPRAQTWPTPQAASVDLAKQRAEPSGIAPRRAWRLGGALTGGCRWTQAAPLGEHPYTTPVLAHPLERDGDDQRALATVSAHAEELLWGLWGGGTAMRPHRCTACSRRTWRR